MGFHTSLLVVDSLETLALTVRQFTGPVESKHFLDAAHNSLDPYYLPGSWRPLFVVIKLWPWLR